MKDRGFLKLLELKAGAVLAGTMEHLLTVECY